MDEHTWAACDDPAEMLKFVGVSSKLSPRKARLFVAVSCRQVWQLQWNDGLVRRLAEQAYEHRLMPAGTLDPDRLAVLADALEEAGADAALVAHLREPGPHWRGCHALDLLLGRS